MSDKATQRMVAVFDFDGTLTTRDTLLAFIRFSCGELRFLCGFLLFSPLMVLMKLHLYPNWKCKQRFFSWFFKGMPYADFRAAGVRFAETHFHRIRHPQGLDALRRMQALGAGVYVVSASIEEWVRPCCRLLGVEHVMGTQIETDAAGKLTGRFLSANCYGQEKVRRLLAVEPCRDTYFLYAFGDSRGDRELLSFADKGEWIKKYK